MAAGLSTWAKFCDLAGLQELPICADVVISFAGICRSHGAYAQYVSHLKVACEILGHPTGWRDDNRISRAADGIKKSGAFQRTPKLAVGKLLIQRLALNTSDAIPEVFFLGRFYFGPGQRLPAWSGLRRPPSEIDSRRSSLMAKSTW